MKQLDNFVCLPPLHWSPSLARKGFPFYWNVTRHETFLHLKVHSYFNTFKVHVEAWRWKTFLSLLKVRYLRIFKTKTFSIDEKSYFNLEIFPSLLALWIFIMRTVSALRGTHKLSNRISRSCLADMVNYPRKVYGLTCFLWSERTFLIRFISVKWTFNNYALRKNPSLMWRWKVLRVFSNVTLE